jgi:hypothetical protein
MKLQKQFPAYSVWKMWFLNWKHLGVPKDFRWLFYVRKRRGTADQHRKEEVMHNTGTVVETA